MRKNFGVQTWLYPMPVLIIGTYDENGNPDAMNAAWGGIHDTNQIGVCIDPSHKTAENLQLHKCFTVSIGDAAHVKECDYVGLVSVIEELPMTLECRLIRYDSSAGCAVAEIVNISADERILDENGKISVEKLRPICFDPVHHVYREMGAEVGKAFHDGLELK